MFNKWFMLGYKTEEELEADRKIFINVKYGADEVLSILGVIGPKANGESYGAHGQIQDSIRPITKYNRKEGWTEETAAILLNIWNKWHRNDLIPGCEHQQHWDGKKLITIAEYTYGDMYRRTSDRILTGGLDFAEYQRLTKLLKEASALCGTMEPEHDRVNELITLGYLKIKETRQKPAGQVGCNEHHEGLLSRVCPECGFRYGSAWNFVPVPKPLLDWLRKIPETKFVNPWGSK